MPNSWFQFREFRVDQASAAFKVGTDACLLGAWAPVTGVDTALDIGTGSGVIALMLAQRAEKALIHAIEPDEGSYLQATGNFKTSPWSDRLMCFHTTLQDFVLSHGSFYDLVVSNPPFFAGSTKNRDARKAAARHEENLSLDTLLSLGRKMITSRGKLAVILPFERRKDFEKLVANYGWHEQLLLYLRPTAGKVFHRFMSEVAQYKPETVIKEEMTLFRLHNHYTPEAAKLLQPFYLKL